MEHLGQIPMSTLTDREILLHVYFKLQDVIQASEENKKENEKQYHEFDKRLVAIEKKMSETEVLKALVESNKKISDNKTAKMLKWYGLGLAAFQIIISIILYLINKK